MSVRRIGRSWYADVTWSGKRYRKRSPLNTKQGARELELLLAKTLSENGNIDTLKPTASDEADATDPVFGEFAERWMREYVHANNRATTVLNKKLCIHASLIPHFGGKRLSAITPRDVEAFKRARLSDGVKASTVNTELVILGSCLRMAQEWGLLVAVPRIRSLKTPKRCFDQLSEDELAVLVECASEPWSSMILVGARTGVRFGELAALTYGDVRDTGRSATIIISKAYAKDVLSPTKNNTIRAVPLVSEALECMRRESGLGVDEHIFTFRNRPVRYCNARAHLRRTCVMAGMRKIGWHTLRHTFASHLVQRGAPLVAVRELLGHADIKTTMRYAHLRPETLVGAVQLLEKPSVAERLGHYTGKIPARSPTDTRETAVANGHSWLG